MLNVSYKKVLAGESISGFPISITLTSISPHGAPLGTEFVAQYVPTFRSLLATYDFMYDEYGVLGNVNSLPDVRNHLVLDLNNGLDMPHQPPPVDDSPFASLVEKTHVFYADKVQTEHRVHRSTHAATNVVFRFQFLTEGDAHEGMVWYQGETDNVGDGTVPKESAMGQFIRDSRVKRYLVLSRSNTHTGLMSNEYVQWKTLEILGVDPERVDISTDLAGSEVTSAVWNAHIDPVDMVVMDGSGRRFGYSTATGPLTEIPNSVWIGGDQGIGWIFGSVTLPLRVELTGHGGTYDVQVSGAQPGLRGGYEDSGFLGVGEKVSAMVDIDELPLIYVPLILHRAGGSPPPTATASPTAVPTLAPTPTVTPTPGQQTVTLDSVADATVFEGYPSLNLGDVIDMWAGYDDSLDPYGEIVRGLVKFDLTGVPAGANVQNATLRVYYMGHWEFPGWVDRVTAYRAQGNWGEMSVTWNNKPGYGASYGSVDVVADEDWGWRELDVTGLVRDWVNGTSANQGIMLRGEEGSGPESSRRRFYAREGEFPPQLVITHIGAANVRPKHPGSLYAKSAHGESIITVLKGSEFQRDSSGRVHRVLE